MTKTLIFLTVACLVSAAFIAGSATGEPRQPARFTPTSTDEGRIYEGVVRQQVIRSRQIDGAIAVVGDSNTFGFATSTLGGPTENFGINGDTSARVLHRLGQLDLSRAKAVVLAVGTNDWNADRYAGFSQTYERLLAAIPEGIPVVASAIPPVNEARLAEKFDTMGMNTAILWANSVVREACEKRPNCTFAPMPETIYGPDGGLAAEADSGDGIHLSPAAYRDWAKSLQVV